MAWMAWMARMPRFLYEVPLQTLSDWPASFCLPPSKPCNGGSPKRGHSNPVANHPLRDSGEDGKKKKKEKKDTAQNRLTNALVSNSLGRGLVQLSLLFGHAHFLCQPFIGSHRAFCPTVSIAKKCDEEKKAKVVKDEKMGQAGWSQPGLVCLACSCGWVKSGQVKHEDLGS